MEFHIGDDVEVPVSYGGVGYAKIVDAVSPNEFLIRWYWTYDDFVKVAGFNEEELDEEGFEDEDIAETRTETTVAAPDIIRRVYLREPRFFFDDATQELSPLEPKEQQEKPHQQEKLAQRQAELEAEQEELAGEGEVEWHEAESMAEGESSEEEQTEQEEEEEEESGTETESESEAQELAAAGLLQSMRGQQPRKRAAQSSLSSPREAFTKRTRQFGRQQAIQAACQEREVPEGQVESMSEYRQEQQLDDIKETRLCHLEDYDDPTGFKEFLQAPDLWETAYAAKGLRAAVFPLRDFGYCAGEDQERVQQIHNHFFYPGAYNEPRLNATVTLTPIRTYFGQCRACNAPRALTAHFQELDWDVGADCASKLALLGQIVALISRIRYEVCANPGILDDDQLLSEIWLQLCEYNVEAQQLLANIQKKYKAAPA